jgi:trehalose 6-phosphate synthase/phosphatase
MRLLVVSNRLPIVTAEENGQLVFRESAGGLVSGISAYLESLRGSSFAKPEYKWLGWPGMTVDAPAARTLMAERLLEFNAHPVFLSARSMEKVYLGFCNKTIWPLFHYFPSYAVYEESQYTHYKCVNQIFCEAVARVMEPDDLIWVHDYHLMLLPKMLRECQPSAQIGFFLHIPFPSFELFRLLPVSWRSDILEGILGADLVGFHTYDYAQYFLHCVLRVLGHEHNVGKILLPNHLVKVDTLPMGIDFHKFHSAAGRLRAQHPEGTASEGLKDVKVVLSVDRLDYTKGILERLEGYDLFLESNPQWHRKVVLVLIVVPSRVAVDQYQTIKKHVDELVGKINGKFSTVAWTPISYQYRYLPFEPLVSLYAASDAALITPLRDGMNLVAKEYLASRTDKTGVLILSEMAGAAKELAEAVIINPNNPREIAAALKTALEMPLPEQVRRNTVMQQRLQRYDVVRWAEDFLTQLPLLKAEQERLSSRLLGPTTYQKLLDEFSRAPHRTIFLDYDGTLVPFADNPRDAGPTPDLLATLRTLAQSPRNNVVLISGRDKDAMHDWFADLDVTLVAEHGAWAKPRAEDWRPAKPLDNSWKPVLLPMLQTYADRLPGAFVEEKQSAIAWHYRRADPELASARVKELVDDIVNFTANIDVQVLQGSKVVEVRSGGINKGSAAAALMPTGASDFIIAIGDGCTDEDLFRALPASAWSIKVGNEHSLARFNLRSPIDVLKLLKEMCTADRP